MNALQIAAVALTSFTFATLLASLGSLESAAKNESLPALWVMAGVGWIALIVSGVTLAATGHMS